MMNAVERSYRDCEIKSKRVIRVFQAAFENMTGYRTFL